MLKLKHDELQAVYNNMNIAEGESDVGEFAVAIRRIAGAIRTLAWHIDRLREEMK